MSMDSPVLVLNQNFEPLNVCNTKRAVILLFLGKAEIVENGRDYIRTPSTLFPRPSVIRLDYMVRRPRPRPNLSRKEVFRRDEYQCQYCGRRTKNLTLDHVVPRHRGGRHTWENLVSACRECNRRKGGRTPREAGMHLMKKPEKPKATYRYIFQPHLKNNESWEKFVDGWM